MKTFYGVLTEAGEPDQQKMVEEPEKVQAPEPEPLKGYIIWSLVGRAASTPGASFMTVCSSSIVSTSLLDAIQTFMEKNLEMTKKLSDEEMFGLLTNPLGALPVIIDTHHPNSSKCGALRIWTGMKPKEQKEVYNRLLSFDPWGLVWDLERHFQDARTAFTIHGDSKKELAENVGEIYAYFKANPLNLYLLDSDPELKKKVIEATGIKDMGKLGKAMSKGMI
jgi:hypothetical protein